MAQLPNFPNILQNGPGNVPDADAVMDNYQHIRDFLNAKTLEPSDLAPGSEGQIIVCNASGVPQYVTASGDVDVAAGGAITLTDDVREALGLSGDGVIRRGKSIIATEESRTNVAYGTLTTPDQVANVVLPADGQLVVGYEAMVKSSVASAGRAALFLNGIQIKSRWAATGITSPLALGAATIGTDAYRPIMTAPGVGLVTFEEGTAQSSGTTGQVLGAFTMESFRSKVAVEGQSSTSVPHLQGGLLAIFAAAGTYTVSIRFKATSGSVTAKERKLWVEAKGF